MFFPGPWKCRAGGGKVPAGPLPVARRLFLAVAPPLLSARRRGLPPRDELTRGKFKGKKNNNNNYKFQSLLEAGERRFGRGKRRRVRRAPGRALPGLSPRVSVLPPQVPLSEPLGNVGAQLAGP